MYKHFRALFLFSCLCIGSQQLQAQQLSNSPYSRFGLGDVVQGTGSVRNAGMGTVGVGNASSALINDLNPALLYYNNLVTFEAAVASELKRLSDRQNTQIDGTANLNYLALAIPVARRWTASVGLRPYSRVNYITYLSAPVAGVAAGSATNFTQYKGTGGLSEVYFANGVRIANGLTAGVSGSYLFGTIDKQATTILVEEGANSDLQQTLFHTTTKYSGFTYKGGLHYRKRFSDKLSLGMGATYSGSAVIEADRQVSQERRALDESLISGILTDSLEGSTTIPQSLQVGLAIDNNRSWSVGVDYTSTKGSEFRGFSLKEGEGRQELGDSYKLGVGTEFTPDPNSVSSYFKRVTYRVGGYYGNSEIQAVTTGNSAVRAHNLKDMAITWGFSLPLGKGVRPPDYTRALLNTSFAIGQLEAKESGLKEQYLRVSLGVTFNNQWFIKRKFD